MTDRKRQPRGVPVGGQFAEGAHDEAVSALGDRDPRAEESRALHDLLDEDWRTVTEGKARGASIVPGGADRDRRERESWERLRELASHADSRGFEPYTFSSPKPIEFLDGEDDNTRGLHSQRMQSDPEGCVREIEQDIDRGVQAGSLSPLFDYEVRYERGEDIFAPPELSVTATLKPGVEQGEYRDVGRARIASIPRYSPRVRATVTRLRERLESYRSHAVSDYGLGEQTHSSLTVKVRTSLTKLGD